MRQTRQSVRAYERPKFYLDVAPGLIRLRKKLAAEKVHFGHDDGVDETADEGPTRGRIIPWTQASRNRMTTTLESLDYEPMFRDPSRRAAMVTLTLPGRDETGDLDYWERLVPDIATFKHMVNDFVTAYKIAWGEKLLATWKMEFQRRGAPHLHILMVPPPRGAKARMRVVGADGRRKEITLPFTEWASRRWAGIVGATGLARYEHEMRGVDVDWREVARYSDPRRIGSYFAKHGSFTAKDYQNDMPAHWAAAIAAGESTGGRYWGYWGLEKAVESTELQPRRTGAARPAAWMMDDSGPVRHRHQQPSALELADENEKPSLCQLG